MNLVYAELKQIAVEIEDETGGQLHPLKSKELRNLIQFC